MVGRTGKDRLGAVELLESDQQGQFVLEGLRAERPKQIGFRAGRGVPSIRRPDQQCTPRDPTILEGLDFRREGPTRKLPAAFIEKDPEAALGEFTHPLRETRAGFDKVNFKLRATSEPACVFLDAEARKIQRGLAGSEDFPGQRWTGLKSAAW